MKRKPTRWFLTLTALAGFARAAFGAVSVPGVVEVSGDRYRVRDVVPAVLQARLSPAQLEQPLGVSPVLGKPLTVPGALLKARLKSRTGVDLSKTAGLLVPPSVVVRRKGQSLGAEALVSALLGQESLFAQHHPGLRALAKKSMSPLALPVGQVGLSVPSAQQPVVVVSVAGREVTRVNLDLFYDLQAPTFAAARSIGRGEVLTETDAKTLWVSWRQSGAATVPVQVAGKVAKRRVAAGAPISADLLAEPTVIRRGDSVKVLARSGRLVVSLGGQALSAGGQGDLVRVRHEGFRRVFTARVLGPGLVGMGDLAPPGEVN